MRLLLYPVYNQHVLKADSIYHITEALARYLAENGWHVHWVVPLQEREEDGNALTWYKTDGTVLEDPSTLPAGVTLRPTRLYTSYRMQESTTPEWVLREFHPLWREGTVVDAILTTSSIHGHFLKQAFQETYNRADPTPVISWDLLLRGGEGAKEVTSIGESEIILQTLGHAVTEPIFESPIAHEIALENARKFLKPTHIKKLIEDRAAVIPLGANFDKVDKHASDEKNERFTVYFGGRFTPSKGIDLIADVADYLYKRGTPIDIEFSTGTKSANRIKLLQDAHSSIHVHTGMTQETAFKVMTRCHAFICASSHELFGGAFWEQMYAGLIGIFKKAKWNEGLLPPDYPLLFDTPIEAYTMLKDVYENYEQWRERLAWVPQWVEENYDYRYTFERMEQRISQIIEDTRETKTNDDGPLFQAVMEGAKALTEGFTTAELEKQLASSKLVSAAGVQGDGNPARIRSHISRYKLHRMLMLGGYRDDTTSPNPRYRRE